VHYDSLGIANGLTGKTFDTSPQSNIFPFNALCVGLADPMLLLAMSLLLDERYLEKCVRACLCS
jgi:hypothetical protein